MLKVTIMRVGREDREYKSWMQVRDGGGPATEHAKAGENYGNVTHTLTADINEQVFSVSCEDETLLPLFIGEIARIAVTPRLVTVTAEPLKPGNITAAQIESSRYGRQFLADKDMSGGL